jgi:archaemetzincin
VGLTDRDLCIPNLNFVFGLSERETGTAVVSWHRLRGKDGELASRIAKEVIHEVGHLKGLEHCKNRECVMWFSNTLEDAFRKKSEFCPSCRFKLGI